MVVVGAGIAGAAAAYLLRAARPDLDVTVLEGAATTGGKLAVAEVGGMRTDVGAEAMLQRRPEGVELARTVGLGDDVVVPATAGAALWNRGEMRPIPRSLMGVPGDLAVLDGVLSADGLVAAGRDAALGPMTALTPGDDVSVGDLVADRLGEEVVQRLVEPMLGGVYAGHAHALSARAAVPGLLARLDGTRTLVEAAAAAMTPVAGSGGPVFAGIRGGVGRLPGVALAASGALVQTDSMVRGLRRTATGWVLEVGPTRSPRQVEADAVVLATPARPTSRLLAPVAPAVAAELAGIDYASMVVVTLAVRGFDAPGSGFLVPPVDGRAVKGATYSFAKWDWVGQGAPDGLRLLRCSIGRHREEQVLQRTDEEIVAVAVADLSAAVGSPLLVVDAAVRRWGGALPQYAVGHVARVARVRAGLADLPGLALCGAAYDGVGVPATIASAGRAVDEVLTDLAPRRDPSGLAGPG